MTEEQPAGLPAFVPASSLMPADEQTLTSGPTGPGVYVFRSEAGAVLYVGKSRSLRRRVLDHLRIRTEKDSEIIPKSRSIEFLPTASEREALLLESALIKEHQPTYNAMLKDDRSYPYLAVTLGEAWPRVLFVRRPRRGRNNLIFGPYTSAREARSVARLLAETFQIRRCVRLPKRACLYYYLKTCSAPCIGGIDSETYRAQVDRAIKVLRGRGKEIRPALEAEMRTQAQRREFERAALLRDALSGLRALEERQSVFGPGRGSADAIALALPESPGTLRVAVGLLHIMDGEVRSSEPHLLAIPADDLPDRGEMLRHFLVQYYAGRPELPHHVYIEGSRPPGEGMDEALSWLTEQRGVEVTFQPTGHPAALVKLASRLASAHLTERRTRAAPSSVRDALQQWLDLPKRPDRIEGVDISILQGSEAVGSLVVFDDGAPAKSEYRRYRIRDVEGMNDFAMVAEVVRRRFSRRVAEGLPLPDLLLIDGGAGQLAAAEAALADVGVSDRVPVIGLAKREEEVYRVGRREPFKFNRNAAPMLLLRAVRDEAHRFAVGYHRRRRSMGLRAEATAARTRIARSGSARSSQ